MAHKYINKYEASNFVLSGYSDSLSTFSLEISDTGSNVDTQTITPNSDKSWSSNPIDISSWTEGTISVKVNGSANTRLSRTLDLIEDSFELCKGWNDTVWWNWCRIMMIFLHKSTFMLFFTANMTNIFPTYANSHDIETTSTFEILV